MNENGKLITTLPREPRRALADLAAADQVMARAIAKVGPFALPARKADLHMLCSCVIGQSISVRAAECVVERFSKRIGERHDLKPQSILECPFDELQAVGLTKGKASAICALAELWQREDWSEEKLQTLPDEIVMDKLVALKGIGPWTAKMFLIFGLRRPDILPHEDLGLREALMQLYNLEERPGRKRTEQITDKWRPWRTVGTVYAWQFLMKQKDMSLASNYGWW